MTFIAEIYNNPVNATANIAQEDVVFSCVIMGTGILWQIDSIVYFSKESELLERRGIMIGQVNKRFNDISGTVTVRVSPENNGTEIVCIAEDTARASVTSSTGYLIVRRTYSLTKRLQFLCHTIVY